MSETTALVTVVSGSAYEKFAEKMFASAEEFFWPTEHTSFVTLDGREGWPAATMFRYHVLLERMPLADYVFLIDADMLVVGELGPAILPNVPGGWAITATLHPGYVGQPAGALPFERRPESAAYASGWIYYCGGFIGGSRYAMKRLARRVVEIIDADVEKGLCPTWHDESAINAVLAADPPSVTLDPRYCTPADSGYYRSFWPIDYSKDARILAVDKDRETRGDR